MQFIVDKSQTFEDGTQCVDIEVRRTHAQYVQAGDVVLVPEDHGEDRWLYHIDDLDFVLKSWRVAFSHDPIWYLEVAHKKDHSGTLRSMSGDRQWCWLVTDPHVITMSHLAGKVSWA